MILCRVDGVVVCGGKCLIGVALSRTLGFQNGWKNVRGSLRLNAACSTPIPQEITRIQTCAAHV